MQSPQVAGALYRHVYESLRAEIEAGQPPVGERLPSEAHLTRRFDVSVITVKRALDMLRADGFILRRPRVGTVVVSDVATTLAAGGPAQQGIPSVGCVLTNFDDTFGTHVLGGLLDASQDTANLVLKRSIGDPRREDEAVRGLVAGDIRALILEPASSEYVPPSVLELVTRGFPVVILDRSFDGVPVSTVCSDNVDAAKRATEHLFSLGHTRVGLVSSSNRVSTVEDRTEGFVRAHAEFHVTHQAHNDFDRVGSTIPGSARSAEDDVEALTEYLAAHPSLTGLVATEYAIANLVRDACARLGRSVPGDLSIVCFDHPDPFPRFLPRTTHMAQDQERMGASALTLALELLGGDRTVRKVVLPTELVLGDSTAPPPEGGA